MRSRMPRLLCCLLLLGTPGTLLAQNDQCALFPGNAGNLCNAAVDGATIYHPVVGQILSGGNPELGRVGMLGGLGHAALTFRANVTRLTLPDDGYDGSTPVVGAGEQVVAPEATIDLAVGLFKGFGSGLFALDLLGAVQLLPASQDNVTIDPGARRVGDVALGFGYGARLGLYGHEDSPFALTASLMRRRIPRFTYTSGAYAFGTDLDATNLRAVVGWHASIFSLGVGGGVDWYTGDGFGAFDDPALPLSPQTVPIPLSSRRFLVFADAALVFPVVSLAAEIGYQLGEDTGAVTTFEGYDPSRGLVFLSAGLKLGF